MSNFLPKFFPAIIVILAASGSVSAQVSPEQLAPENYSTLIAKKLASTLSKPDELKKVEVNFVNNSSATLKCKLSVNGIWEMVMRNKASLEFVSKQNQDSRASNFTSSMTNQIIKETALILDKVDEFCSSAK